MQSGKLYGNVSIHSVHLSPCTLVLQEHTPNASQPSDPCSSQPHAKNIGWCDHDFYNDNSRFT